MTLNVWGNGSAWGLYFFRYVITTGKKNNILYRIHILNLHWNSHIEMHIAGNAVEQQESLFVANSHTTEEIHKYCSRFDLLTYVLNVYRLFLAWLPRNS